MKIRTFIVMIALLAGASAAHAQDRTLERIQNMIATGRLTEARNTLLEWERDNADPESTATSDDRARAPYLAGALSTDAKAAEDAFIAVVLSYPSSPVAAEALLRLGQSLVTAGDNDRAIMYLERLRSDYPFSPERQTGLLWLTRAQLASGDAALACGTARQSLFGTTNENVRMLIELERDRACAASGGVATTPAPDSRPRRRAARDDAAFDANPGARRPAASADVVVATPPATPPAATPPVEVPPVERRPADVRPPVTPPAPTPRAIQPAPTPPANTPVTTPAETQPPEISTAWRANPLPDLGIAVDPDIREPAPARAAADTRVPNDSRSRRDDSRSRRDPVTSAARADSRTEGATATGPEYAIQAAAFSDLRPAQTIAAEIRAKGFDARIVQVPGSPYYRVRVGAFATTDDAAAAALRIRDAGFATLIVKDVRLERQL
ncbi:MAG TPA: SPOR domain-containing protein [Longimicrobiales bacterium]|nr:SPOR domain-containing protein [Longimicrobiales bacterium]